MLIGASTGSIVVARGTRPRDGRRAAVPLHCDGQRREPPRSLPRPSGVIPVANATASPPLEPPGVRSGSQGFRVAPRSALSVCQRSAKSGRLVRAIGIAPASRKLATCGASRPGSASASALTPWVVADPATSLFSLTVNGTPCSGPVGSPAATFLSAESPAARHSSPSSRVMALTRRFTASIRARCSVTTSRLETRFWRIARASCAAPRLHSFVVVLAFISVPPQELPVATELYERLSSSAKLHTTLASPAANQPNFDLHTPASR